MHTLLSYYLAGKNLIKKRWPRFDFRQPRVNPSFSVNVAVVKELESNIS